MNRHILTPVLTMVIALGLVAAVPPAATTAASAQPAVTSGQQSDARSAQTRRNEADRVQAAADTTARKFIKVFGCPLKSIGANSLGRITRGNRDAARRAVMRSTMVATYAGGVCTGVKTPAAITDKYRTAIKRLVQPGDFLVRFRWRDASGRAHGTVGSVSSGRSPEVRFEPVMSTANRQVPAGTPSRMRSADRISADRISVRSPASRHMVVWYPWGAGRGSCVVRNGLGVCAARRSAQIQITVDEAGNIIAEQETVTVTGSAYAQTARRMRAEIITKLGVQCKQVTVQIFWTSSLGTIIQTAGTGGFDVDITASGPGSGSSVEFYTLCADGTQSYSGLH